MARVSTYLHFPRNTEDAFNFYRKVFGGEFSGNGMMRYKDVPASPGAPSLPENDKNLIMHVELPILNGYVLMGADVPESLGFSVKSGNNVQIIIEPDTRPETKKLFQALAEGGKVTQELQDAFWGGYYGSCTDKFGVNWMFNCSEKAANG